MRITLLIWACMAGGVTAAEHHVSMLGHDANPGTAAQPLRSIQAAAGRAQPGDVVTVHAGIYRERVDPPRGGVSDSMRIVYEAAPGEQVSIKGSEVVKGWTKAGHDTWKVVLPNTFFAGFNPYADEIHGDWFKAQGRKHHTGAVYLNGHWLAEAATKEQVMGPTAGDPCWFAEVGDKETTIWAQFRAVDPNQEPVEINVRRSVFYPTRPGRNFITVRGFTLEQAATPWSPPTAEQIGLVGTHWSKGWIIEDNTIRYSTCSGVTLGKHGDQFDNTSQNSAEGYIETIKRGLAAGWSRQNIGHHVVRNNRISHCEQAGIVGSLGAAFSEVSGNEIHDIHVRQLFGGAEQAAIKFHGAIDTVIRDNHIFRANRGIWLDWMAQGTRATGNLVHDIAPEEDLFVEVNHGPFLIDHNLFLSCKSVRDLSEGGAYAHNLFSGTINVNYEFDRDTPWHEQHETTIAGLTHVKGGDNRFFNNVFIEPAALDGYDNSPRPNRMAGNVFLSGAIPSKWEASPLVLEEVGPRPVIERRANAWQLQLQVAPLWAGHAGQLVTTGSLGTAQVTGHAYVQPDGKALELDTDYSGRSRQTVTAGPFAGLQPGRNAITVWPKD